MTGCQGRALDVELLARDGAQRAFQSKLGAAELLVLPCLHGGQDSAGEGLVDLEEVEVVEGPAVAGQQARGGVSRSHQQALVAVDEVDCGCLGIDDVGKHR